MGGQPWVQILDDIRFVLVNKKGKYDALTCVVSSE
jgi:hypothetical protein